jgi:hypothetical protein
MAAAMVVEAAQVAAAVASLPVAAVALPQVEALLHLAVATTKPNSAIAISGSSALHPSERSVAKSKNLLLGLSGERVGHHELIPALSRGNSFHAP